AQRRQAMPSKEFIEKVAREIMMARHDGGCSVKNWNTERLDNPHVDQAMRQASAAISTVLAALQEPTEGMLDAADKEDRDENYCVTYSDYWRAMLAASALGEQSE
ncbi:hypothetical protein, partial [Brucella sp. 22210]|uniref:hypothetical protein n=1 Tax=Brucella sp. 22210 TaxID=3453892 RepID=UPI003F864EE7